MALSERIREEYERAVSTIESYEKIIGALPKGYLTTKTVKGRQYNYLQWRDGRKVRSQYVDYNALDEVSEQVYRRKDYEQKLKEIKRVKNDLEKILKYKL